MDDEVKSMLNRSPRVLPWFVTQVLLTVSAIYFSSAFLGIAAGVAIGAYFGNYRGRFAVIDAWSRQLKLDHEKRLARLESQ